MPNVRLASIVVALALCAGAAMAQVLPPPNAALQAGIAALPAEERAPLLQLYAPRGFAPLWHDGADEALALAALRGADAQGLDPARYRLPAPASEAGGYDLALTRQVLRYARDLRLGVANPMDAADLVWLPRATFDAAGGLAAALDGGRLREWLADLPPQGTEYRGLVAALAHYRAAAAAGGWPAVPAVRKIDLSVAGADRAALAARLRAEDPALAGDEAPALDAALERFQAHVGLPADGVAGAKTIAALNVSAASRAETILANLERWRWLPHTLPVRYIMANAADASLVAFDGPSHALESRVIVGKPATPTPIFSAQAEALTLNPPWEVPPSIIRKEILPAIARHPNYLGSHHMVMADGRVRQLPGADNALGRIEVEMPNRFSTYLHDTSAPSLFARDERHLSHGCVRVQQIAALASWLLTGDVAAGRARLEAGIATGKTQHVPLDNTVPVYVLYWTAIPKPDGTADFRADVYGRDARLLAEMRGQAKSFRARDASGSCLPPG